MNSRHDPISICLQFSSDEAWALAQLGFSKRKHRYEKILWITMLITIAYTLPFVFLLFLDKESRFLWPVARKYPLATAFLLIFFLFLCWRSFHRAFEQKEQDLKEEYAGLWELTVADEGLFVGYGNHILLIAWERIEQADADDSSLYIKIDDGEHLILPRERILEGDYDRFVNVIQTKVGK